MLRIAGIALLITLFLTFSGCGGGTDTFSPPPPPPPPPQDNPVPVISSLSATSAPEGWPGIPLLINGTGFVSGSTMRWNGSDRASTRLSDTVLKTAVPMSDLAQPGTAQVTVFNPAPGGGTSSAITFTIEAVAPGAVGVVERSSVATDLTEADSGSFSPSISADGRYVAFFSEANDLGGGSGNGLMFFFAIRVLGQETVVLPR